MTPEQIVEIIGVAFGLIYFVCEFRAHISMWYVGIVVALFYTYIYFTTGLYANAALNLYNLGASIYGLILWRTVQKNSTDEAKPRPITHCPKKLYFPLIAIVMLLWIAIWAVLLKIGRSDISLLESFRISLQSPFEAFGNSASPIFDSLSMSLSIVAMWIMAQKYIDHWYFWFVVEIITVVMCAISGLYYTAGMFVLYAFGVIFAFFNWRKKMQEN